MVATAAQALEFLGLVCHMRRVPNQVQSADLDAFMAQLLDFKLKQVAYAERLHELGKKASGNRQILLLKRSVIASLYRLNLLSNNLLGKFPKGLTARAVKTLTETPSPIKSLLHADIENRFERGTLFRDIMALN